MNQTVHKVNYLLDRPSIKNGETIILQNMVEEKETMEQDFYQVLFYLFDLIEEDNQ